MTATYQKLNQPNNENLFTIIAFASILSLQASASQDSSELENGPKQRRIETSITVSHQEPANVRVRQGSTVLKHENELDPRGHPTSP
ncbi:hypothetical protein [Pelagicoccus sp. SDUM812002]|uniref:hypothetical protein n=1 Tax=Pelagicoccus sp. SDUM812002 TaxID=3041266 RepID=UPI00280DC8D7|nr:hypothetical protein [Pelagicoccus sp. SDUM812002]MDQ8185771.1 hypothetical protein [Pelagicoccus sp. SDUM812002]